MINQILKSTINWLFCTFTKIKPGRVFCESFGGRSFSCNPKYITNYLLNNTNEQYQIIWVFNDPDKIEKLDDRIVVVKKRTLKEWFYLQTAEFIICNFRMLHWTNWKKRRGQKYIMTWHGSNPIKKIEFDAASSMSKTYLNSAEIDSKAIDLMFSSSRWYDELIKRAFHYYGETLKGIKPRNEIFYCPDELEAARKKVYSFYNIKKNVKILLYAPTFRADNSVDFYIKLWGDILKAVEGKFDGEFVLMTRLHPGIAGKASLKVTCEGHQVIDATYYEDMQELLCATDVLVTDYSSVMFEMAMMHRPSFLYVEDMENYDRGFYFPFKELPFPMAMTTCDLKKEIDNFNKDEYEAGLNHLLNDTLGNYPSSNTCKNLADWMTAHSITVNN